jgi:dihydrofolate reductase
MRHLSVFNQISLDGYFSGEKGDISWAKANHDTDWKNFVNDNANRGGVFLFGRVTYELMKSYWPTPEAMKNDPIVAGRMNNQPKIVFSRTLSKASWNNTTLVKGDLVSEVRRMKNEPGEHMVIMGSGSIVAQLTQAGLIDEYQFVLVPVVLGKGKTMFEGLEDRKNLELTRTRTFSEGNVLLGYEPKKSTS